jgi:L-threonylcarbamoyladenylate synthase
VRRITIEALREHAEDLLGLSELLGNGGVAAVPTESSYALSADPWSEAGVRRVFETKGRDTIKALPVLFAAREQLEGLGVIASAATLDQFFQIWPAPLTVVLPVRSPLPASRGLLSLAVRLPAEPRLRQLLASVGPLTGTSANRSGSPALNDPDAVEAIFRRDVDLLVDGGKTPGGKSSTIIDATRDPPALVRDGAFPWV